MSNVAVFRSCFTIAIASLNTLYAEDDSPPTMLLCDLEGYQLHLRVAENPTLLDYDWLILHFTNLSSKYPIIHNLDYEIRYEIPGVGSKSTLFSGRCSGDRLASGTVRTAESPLTMMAGLCHFAAWSRRLDESHPIIVEGTTHVSLSVSHGGDSRRIPITTPKQGTRFSFSWLPPMDAGSRSPLEAFQKWYQEALVDQDEWERGWKRDGRRYRDDDSLYRSLSRRTQLLAGMLDEPEVVKLLTDEFLMELAELKRHDMVTYPAKKILFDRGASHKPYLEAYAERIAGWRQVNEMHPTGFWHPDLFDALISRASRPHDDGNTNSFGVSSMAFRVLEDHREDWDSEPDKVAAFNNAKRVYRLKYFLNYYGYLTFAITLLVIVAIWFQRSQRQHPNAPLRASESQT